MRLQHLQLILAIAEMGTLRAAAERMNVTQPALTKALRQLEDEFGTAMVLRSPKGVRLTHRNYITVVQNILSVLPLKKGEVFAD
ncbi:MAG: LysR family transcriptional regulator, partial [Burkholderiaceae bacterium]